MPRQKKANNKIVCIDMFCGVGGLTRGLIDAGIRVVKGVDADETARETYERNNPGAEFMHADIRDVHYNDIMKGVVEVTSCWPVAHPANHSQHKTKIHTRMMRGCHS